MQFLARLVHADGGSRVVEVSAREHGEVVGCCLGEASSAEAAEDRARARLLQLLMHPPTHTSSTSSTAGTSGTGTGPARPVRRPPTDDGADTSGVVAAAATTAAAATGGEPQAGAPPSLPADATQQPQQLDDRQPSSTTLAAASAAMVETSEASSPSAATSAQEPPPDPEDWSGELAQIDLQLRRLGWQRQQEGTYLERAFGHPSRSRITTYADLIAYLQALQAMETGVEPEAVPVPLRRRDLLSQCDALLMQLAWDAGEGRRFLEQHFQLSSRQQLSDTQLLQFNMLLEETLINRPAPESVPADATATPSTAPAPGEH